MSKTVDYQQSSFNAGELSPLLKGKEELDKYKNGLKSCENALPLVHGPVTRRSGFKYIGGAKESSKKARLIPFEFNEDQAYSLEMGDKYMRVWMDGGYVVGPDAETITLLHMNGDKWSINFIDKSPNAHVVTANGNAQVDTDDPVFGTGNLLCDGVGDYLSIARHTDFILGSNPLTIDTWLYTDVVVGQVCVYYQEDIADNSKWVALWIDYDTDEIYFTSSKDGSVCYLRFNYSTGFAIDTWYHIALIRGWGDVANNWMLTINGTAIDSVQFSSITLPNYGGDPYVGASKATCIPDHSSENNQIKCNGNCVASVIQKKWGNGSMYFSGAADYITVPDNSKFDIQDGAGVRPDLTISAWVRHTDHVGDEFYVSQYEDVNNGWMLWHQHGTGLQFQIVSGGAQVVSLGGAGEITDSDWHHVLLAKKGDEYGLYLDGNQVAFVDDNSMDWFAGDLQIGRKGDGSSYFNGYIDDIYFGHSNHFSAVPVAGNTDTISVPTGKLISVVSTDLLLRGDIMDLKGGLDEYRISVKTRWTANFSVPTGEYPTSDCGQPYEISTPWSQDEVGQLKWGGIGDILYICSPDHNVYKLSRTDHDVWTCVSVDWTNPPWKNKNDTATTLTSGAVNGSGISLVSSVALFSESHVGAYFKFLDGFGVVTTVTDSKNAVWTIKDDLSAVGPTVDWYLSAWNGVDGYPIAITFFEDRLALAGAAGEPTKVRLSETGDYENMETGVADSDPMAYELLSQKHNRIFWLVGGKKLFIGTSGAEFWMSGAGTNSPLTPTSVLAKRESTIGSANIQPVTIGSSLLFVQREGRTINMWRYDYYEDSFGATDIGILAEHYFKDYGIIDIQYAQDPHHIVWALRADGLLLGMTYMRAHEVVGWHKHPTADNTGAGIVESIAVIPGSSQGKTVDEPWILVKRTVNSSTARNIEMMYPTFYGDNIEDGFFVDSGMTYNGPPATVFTGAGHLEGETIMILADGVRISGKSISSGGFTLDNAASVVQVGLQMDTTIEFMVAVLTEMLNSVTTAKRKRIIEILLMLYETSQLKYGVDVNNLFNAWTTAGLTGNILYDTYIKVGVDANPEYEPTLVVKQDLPYPFTLIGIVETIEMEE